MPTEAQKKEVTLDSIASAVSGVSETVKKTADDVNTVKAEFAEKQDKMAAETAKMQEQIDRLFEAQNSALKGENKERAKLEHKYNSAFLKAMRTGSTTEVNKLAGEYKDALVSALEAAGDEAGVIQVKALATDNLAEGGALVPIALAARIVEKQRDFSPVRQYATVERVGTNTLVLPGEADDFGFSWVGEGETNSNDDAGKFQAVEIAVNTAQAIVPVTRQMQRDSAFDIEGYVVRKAAQRLARGEGTAFVTGNGVKKPRGFTTYDAGTGPGQVRQVATVGENVLAHEDLTAVKAPLRAGYRQNARYFFNRFTQAAIENFDGTDGHPLFNMGQIENGVSNTLKGLPWALFDDMAGPTEDTLAFSTNNALVILCADMAAFYAVVDHTAAMTMIVDPYTRKNQNVIEYAFNKDVGGGVQDFEAGVLLKVK